MLFERARARGGSDVLSATSFMRDGSIRLSARAAARVGTYRRNAVIRDSYFNTCLFDRTYTWRIELKRRLQESTRICDNSFGANP